MNTEEQLLEAYNEAARTVSMYNAASGTSWTEEREARMEAMKRLGKARTELVNAGVDVPTSGFML